MTAHIPLRNPIVNRCMLPSALTSRMGAVMAVLSCGPQGEPRLVARCTMGLSRRSETVSARRSTRRRRRPRFEILEDRIDPATFQVADVTGLQTAIAVVNHNPTEQATIKLAPGTYDLTDQLQIAARAT